MKAVKRLYHVSPRSNRDSIREHGLDWRRMSSAETGIAGSPTPEDDAIFLSRDIWEAHWFSGFGEPGRVLDVWEVDLSALRIESTDDGFLICRRAIPPELLTLVEVREVVAPFESQPVASEDA